MIVEFIGELQVAEIDDGNWRLLAPFGAQVSEMVSVHIITVPAGFRTDFASVPRLPVIYAAFGNRAHRPAVLHDYLYTVGGNEADRAFADAVLRDAAIADGMKAIDAWHMWAGVRAFGKNHWTHRTPDDDAPSNEADGS